jgi:hypothetical protein
VSVALHGAGMKKRAAFEEARAFRFHHACRLAGVIA